MQKQGRSIKCPLCATPAHWSVLIGKHSRNPEPRAKGRNHLASFQALLPPSWGRVLPHTPQRATNSQRFDNRTMPHPRHKSKARPLILAGLRVCEGTLAARLRFRDGGASLFWQGKEALDARPRAKKPVGGDVPARIANWTFGGFELPLATASPASQRCATGWPLTPRPTVKYSLTPHAPTPDSRPTTQSRDAAPRRVRQSGGRSVHRPG